MRFPHAPEALLGRNDLKNLATTCKAITSSGRPCRRALASPNTRPKSNVPALNGVAALVQEDGEVQEADFYCWQHKDQAEQRVEQEKKDKGKGRRTKRRSTELFPLQERDSIDTLVQRLGIDAASESPTKEKKTRRDNRNRKTPRRPGITDFAVTQPAQAPYAEKYDSVPPDRRQPRLKKSGFWASLCCTPGNDEDYVEIVRHTKRIEQTRPLEMSSLTSTGAVSPYGTSTRPSNACVPARKPFANQSGRHNSQQQASPNSETNQYLSLLPQDISPQTTSALLAELIKPISPHNEEGYIYIFWLTPQSNTAPPESTARSLLSPDRPSHLAHRRISDVMTEYSFDGSEDVNESAKRMSGSGRKTIMLKIGRANNVTRRMNEWQRRCGYALSLVRWYPYMPSSATPSPGDSSHRDNPSMPLYPELSKPLIQRRESEGVQKVPCVKRVERLIHLELAEQQVKRQCAACGKEHREWFEVEASQTGVKAVDETVRRWVGWAQRECVKADG